MLMVNNSYYLTQTMRILIIQFTVYQLLAKRHDIPLTSFLFKKCLNIVRLQRSHLSSCVPKQGIRSATKL